MAVGYHFSNIIRRDEMRLPHNALVLVVDGKKTLFLRNDGQGLNVDLRVEEASEREDRKDHEIKSDGPGLTAQSGGFGRPAMAETDFHQQEEDRSAVDAADIVNRMALANEFEALVIVAPAKTMGVLRKYWNKTAASRIVLELTKEMTGRPVCDIQDAIMNEGHPPQSDATR